MSWIRYLVFPSPRSRVAILAARLLCVGSLAYGPCNARASDALDEQWLAELQAGIRAPTPDEVDAAKTRAQAALAGVTEKLDSLPEGAMLREALRIDDLTRALNASEPPSQDFRAVVQALRMKRPGGLEPLLAELRQAVETWDSYSTFDEQSLANARLQVERLSDAAANDDEALRSAFAALARTHRIDDSMKKARERISQPNHRVTVNAAYLHAIAARRFDAPIDVRERRDGTLITARGKLPVRTWIALPENHERAVLRLMVEARGPVALTACRGKIHVSACSRLCLDGDQVFHLDAAGVTPHDPSLQLGSRTKLTNVDVNVRVGGRMAERVISKVAARKLPEADRSAARAAKPALEDRVSEECNKIAERINGLFQQLYVGPFLAFDVNPAVTFRSGPEGIQGTANYARYDQLGALSPPPAPRVPLRELSFITSIHESAINNLAEQWGGARLDEATFWMILNEEFKFRSDEVERLPAGRVPAVIQLAEHSPVSLRFSDGGLDVTLRVQGLGSAGSVQQTAESIVRVRYQITTGATGIALVRADDVSVEPNASEDAKAVLHKFFPALLTPRERFSSPGRKQRLVIRELLIHDGWLVLVTGPAPTANVASEVREEAAR